MKDQKNIPEKQKAISKLHSNLQLVVNNVATNEKLEIKLTQDGKHEEEIDLGRF